MSDPGDPGDPDDPDEPADEPATAPALAAVWTLAWFPAAERERAIALWPQLEPDLRDDVAYRRALEGQLRGLAAHATRHPQLVALEVDDLQTFADREHLDAGQPEARNRYAAAQAEANAATPWPPGRNEPCWCGSGRKYKHCCAAL